MISRFQAVFVAVVALYALELGQWLMQLPPQWSIPSYTTPQTFSAVDTESEGYIDVMKQKESFETSWVWLDQMIGPVLPLLMAAIRQVALAIGVMFSLRLLGYRIRLEQVKHSFALDYKPIRVDHRKETPTYSPAISSVSVASTDSEHTNTGQGGSGSMPSTNSSISKIDVPHRTNGKTSGKIWRMLVSLFTYMVVLLYYFVTRLGCVNLSRNSQSSSTQSTWAKLKTSFCVFLAAICPRKRLADCCCSPLNELQQTNETDDHENEVANIGNATPTTNGKNSAHMTINSSVASTKSKVRYITRVKTQKTHNSSASDASSMTTRSSFSRIRKSLSTPFRAMKNRFKRRKELKEQEVVEHTTPVPARFMQEPYGSSYKPPLHPSMEVYNVRSSPVNLRLPPQSKSPYFGRNDHTPSAFSNTSYRDTWMGGSIDTYNSPRRKLRTIPGGSSSQYVQSVESFHDPDST